MRPNYDLTRPDIRMTTNKVLEMIDEGLLDPKQVVLMCLKFMSEDDVDEMCRINEVFVEEDEEEIEIDTLYHDCSEDELRKMGCFDNLNDDDYLFMSESEDI